MKYRIVETEASGGQKYFWPQYKSFFSLWTLLDGRNGLAISHSFDEALAKIERFDAMRQSSVKAVFGEDTIRVTHV